MCGIESSDSAEIEVIANGDRRALEAFYLELRELAKQHGLKLEYQITQSKPGNPSED